MKEVFPSLFVLVWNLDDIVRECWDNTWSLVFDGVVSNQRVVELMGM